MREELLGRGGAVAENCGDQANYDMLPTAFDGHCYYIRNCLIPEFVDGIEIPDALRSQSNWATVVGKGVNIDRPCSREHMRTHKRARWLEDKAEIGDYVLCPDSSPGMTNSPLSKYELFIEASIPVAIVRKEDFQSVFDMTK